MTSLIQINIEHVVAEVAAAFAAYEKALADNDTFLINALTWEGPRTVRYGLGETQYGSEAIRKSGSDRHRISTNLLAKTTIVTTFGYEYATVNTEFASGQSDLRERRTVVWARVGPDSQPEAGLHGGWRIVASHDSVMSPR
ncbi:oxalurate catabolism protein HpxZ [Paraburkholderia jirisanensis]